MPLPPLSLDCLSVTDSSSLDLIESAHRAGADLVSLWLHAPSYERQTIGPENVGACADLLAQTGLGVVSLDAVDLVSAEAMRAVRPAMELGARLGGKAVLAFHYSNPDLVEAADALALLAELAGEFGLGVNLEPIVFGPTATVPQANALIAESGADVGILFDTLHFVRGGMTPGDLAAYDRSRIRYVQINDGPLVRPEEEWFAEATQDRLYPGEGAFPLDELLALLPSDVPWGVEVPRLSGLRAGETCEMQAVRAIQALRATAERVLAQ